MAVGGALCQGAAMAKRDHDRERRLAEALRQNLHRRKAQAREILPGTGRGTGRSPVEGLAQDEDEKG
jgi:hypothetical protein